MSGKRLILLGLSGCLFFTFKVAGLIYFDAPSWFIFIFITYDFSISHWFEDNKNTENPI